MPHGDDIDLAGSAGNGLHGKVELACACIEGGHVLSYAAACGVVAVHDDLDLVADELAGSLDRLIDGLGGGGSGSVLEADAVERDACVQDVSEGLLVELGVVGSGGSGREAHHGDGDLVLEAGVVDGVSAVDEVVHIVEGIEVPDCGHAVLLEHLGMQVDDVARL